MLMMWQFSVNNIAEKYFYFLYVHLLYIRNYIYPNVYEELSFV
jgi:hypothetical protein